MTCKHTPYVGPGGQRQCVKCGEPMLEEPLVIHRQSAGQVAEVIQAQRLARYGAGRPVDGSDPQANKLVDQHARRQGKIWASTCSIGSCQRHQMCMYTPCRHG